LKLRKCILLSGLWLLFSVSQLVFANGTCDRVFDALAKAQIQPNHSFSEHIDSAGHHIYQESITVNNSFYLRNNGQWTRSDQKLVGTNDGNLQSGRRGASCQLVSSESIDGIKVQVYVMHSPWQHDVPSTSTFRVFEDSGLPISWDFQVDGVPSSRVVTRWSFEDVVAPID
jgi:hypothetical protein